MSEVFDDDNCDDGTEFISDDGVEFISVDLIEQMPLRGLLAKVVKLNAVTLQQAADLFGMSPRQFTRLIGGPHFPDTDRGVIQVGSFVFYDKSVVVYYAKKYRVGRVRLSLRKKGIAKSRRKELEAKLKREKARLYVRLIWSETCGERKSSVEYILNSMETGQEDGRLFTKEFRRHFGPDDDERREEAAAAIKRQIAAAAINREITAAAALCGMRADAVHDLLFRAEKAGWMLDERGRVVLRNYGSGTPLVVGADGIAPLTPFEWVDSYIRYTAPHFFGKPAGNGDDSDTSTPQPPADADETLH